MMLQFVNAWNKKEKVFCEFFRMWSQLLVNISENFFASNFRDEALILRKVPWKLVENVNFRIIMRENNFNVWNVTAWTGFNGLVNSK